MNDQIYVFGHQNPDTDSVCSSIAYAALKRHLGYTNVYPYILGKINRETAFALEYFGVETPPLLDDVRIKLSDIELYHPKPLMPEEPIKNAWLELTEGTGNGSRLLPVVDESKRVIGLMSLNDIANIFMEVLDDDLYTHYEILFDNVLKILGGTVQSGAYNYRRVEGAFYIGSDIPIDEKVTDKDIIITGSLENAMRAAYVQKAGAVILTNGVKAEGLEYAKTAIVTCEHPMFKTIAYIKQSISVGSIMKMGGMVRFSDDNFLEDIIDMMKTSSHRNFPVIKKDGTLYGIISRRHLLERRAKNVILIDHNERSQSVEGLETANILEIIDHHRVADIQTDAPLYIRAEPVGCTATIIKKMYLENNVRIPKDMAGLLLSAILSDTLMFSSPTSTTEDRMAAEFLAGIAGVDIDEYGHKMFLVATSLDGFSVDEILGMDRKRFTFGSHIAFISQVNTLDFSGIINREQEFMSRMEEFCHINAADLAILMITNIEQGGSEMLIAGKHRETACTAFGMDWNETSIYLPGIISRKKQVIPKLTHIVS